MCGGKQLRQTPVGSRLAGRVVLIGRDRARSGGDSILALSRGGRRRRRRRRDRRHPSLYRMDASDELSRGLSPLSTPWTPGSFPSEFLAFFASLALNRRAFAVVGCG